VVGTDEHGDKDIFDFDLTRPTLLLVGNETAGLSVAWRDLCDHMVSIPMTGTASSLNAANAATAVLYEASRQRIAADRLPAKQAHLIQAAVDPVQADLDTLPDRPARTAELLRRADK